MTKKITGTCLLLVGVFVVAFIIEAALVRLAWNVLVVDTFGWTTTDLSWKAAFILVGILDFLSTSVKVKK